MRAFHRIAVWARETPNGQAAVAMLTVGVLLLVLAGLLALFAV